MNKQKILLTGATGFFGRNLYPVLQRVYGVDNVIAVSSSDYNLLNVSQINRMFEDIKPDVLVHLAAYSGGIGANRAYPADFFYKNIMLTVPIFHAAMKYHVRKMVYPFGGCAYPASARSPIGEDQLWQGKPQKESAPYSLAKLMGLVASQSYRQQYGFKSTVIIPGNMYGKYDNFSLQDAHVIPTLIRRFYEARLNHDRQVIAWGTGRPTRDFVYIQDVAETIPYFIENDFEGPVNISSGKSTSIRELSNMVAGAVGYEGEIFWDTSKPDGQMEKIFDITLLQSLGFSCNTELEKGLKITADWLISHYQDGSDGLRL